MIEAAPVPAALATADPETPPVGPTEAVVAVVEEPAAAGNNTGVASHKLVTPGTMLANRLFIPSLGIYAPLEWRGMEAGTYRGQTTSKLDLPADPRRLTLYNKGGQPCGAPQQGTVLISGHVSSYGTHGALWSLARLPAGAVAYVSCQNAAGETQVAAWKQTQTLLVDKLELPADLMTNTGPYRLVVVTCAGEIGPDGHYKSNLIRLFTPVSAVA